MNPDPSSEVLATTLPTKNIDSNAMTTPALSVRLYSPSKVLVAALLGGLIGGGLLHWLNLKALQQDKQAKQIMIMSLVFLIAIPSLIVWAHFSPSDNGGAIAAGMYMAHAKQTYGAIYKEHVANEGELGGWWSAIGVGIAGNILTCLGITIILWIITFLA